MNGRPICVGSGWVYRMPCGLITTTKSVWVTRRTCSANGWSAWSASAVCTPSTTRAVLATVSATAVARAVASS